MQLAAFAHASLLRAVYELQGVGRDGQLKLFQKPWAMTCIMFLGMSCCLPLAYYQQIQARRRRDAAAEAHQPLLDDQASTYIL